MSPNWLQFRKKTTWCEHFAAETLTAWTFPNWLQLQVYFGKYYRHLIYYSEFSNFSHIICHPMIEILEKWNGYSPTQIMTLMKWQTTKTFHYNNRYNSRPRILPYIAVKKSWKKESRVKQRCHCNGIADLQEMTMCY